MPFIPNELDAFHPSQASARRITTAGRTVGSINGPNAGRLRTCPQFQVLGAVVGFNSVQMVDLFSSKEGSSKGLFHDYPVFRSPRTAAAKGGLNPYVSMSVGPCRANDPDSADTLVQSFACSVGTGGSSKVFPLHIIGKDSGSNRAGMATVFPSSFGSEENVALRTVSRFWRRTITRPGLSLFAFHRAWNRTADLVTLVGAKGTPAHRACLFNGRAPGRGAFSRGLG